jgi:hypothetical protein
VVQAGGAGGGKKGKEHSSSLDKRLLDTNPILEAFGEYLMVLLPQLFLLLPLYDLLSKTKWWLVSGWSDLKCVFSWLIVV